MPLPMNKVAKRFGKGPGVPAFAGAAPQTGIDSSQGRDIATPTPRRKARREVRKRPAGEEPSNGLGRAFISYL